MSPVVEATTQESRPAAIAAAADAVRAGQVVVFPTDTVYGVGCDAFNAVAVKAMLAAKGRGPEMPPPVLIHAALAQRQADAGGAWVARIGSRQDARAAPANSGVDHTQSTDERSSLTRPAP